MKTSKKREKNARGGNKQQGERRLAQLRQNKVRIWFAISQVKIDNWKKSLDFQKIENHVVTFFHWFWFGNFKQKV